MKKTLTVVASTASLIAAASPAVAAPTSGARVEAIVGWDNLKLDLDDEDLGEDFDAFNESGLSYGVAVGYDIGIGTGTSIGIDLEATTTSVGETVTEGDASVEADFGRDLYAGVRFTTALSDSFNLFVGAGYTNQRVTLNVDDGTDEETISADGDGVRGRAGVQFAFGTSTYLTAEYRYSNYEAGLTRHQAVGGIGFRF